MLDQTRSLPSKRLVGAFAIAVLASVILGLVPWGRTIIYPFALVATWAHEMGHGIGALVTGNGFEELELYSSLGGQALISGADGWSQVVVSAAGLLGPAIVGAAVMVAGSRAESAPYVLAAVASAILLSALFWVRNLFGFVAMVIIGVLIAASARFAPTIVRIGVAQLLAVQMALAAWSSRDYLFIAGFERDGWHPSDTQKIADELWLPYWFWGGLVGGLSIVIAVWAFWFAWIRPFSGDQEIQANPAF